MTVFVCPTGAYLDEGIFELNVDRVDMDINIIDFI